MVVTRAFRLALAGVAVLAAIPLTCGSAGASTVACSDGGSVTIDDGTHTLTGHSGCSGAVAVPAGVTSVSPWALWNARITSVSIPSTVTSIGSSAFGATDLLTGITVDPANPSFASDAIGTLFDKTKTTLIQYPLGRPETTYEIPSTVHSTGENSFFMAYNLTHMEIPSNVTLLGQASFRDASHLSSVTFAQPSGLTTLYGDVFYNASALTSIAFPNSVTSIGANTFVGATSLTNVTLPENPAFTAISTQMFKGATSLTRITIPRSVTQIGSEAFRNATHLERVNFEGAAAPSVPGGSQTFAGTSGGATAYRRADATGWGSSPWNGLQLGYYLPAPPAPSAVARDATVTVTITPPAFGPAPDAYVVRAVEDASRTCSIAAPALSCTVTGLDAGRTYTFTAAASTLVPAITSDPSTASNPVTTSLPAASSASSSSPTDSSTATATAAASSHPLHIGRIRLTDAAIVTSFTATAPGTVTQIGTASPARRGTRAAGILACATRVVVSGPGPISITCRLTNAVRRERLGHAERIVLVTSFTPVGGAPLRSARAVTLARTAPVEPVPTGATPSAVTG